MSSEFPICMAFRPACFIVFEPVGDMTNSGMGGSPPWLPIICGTLIVRLSSLFGDSKFYGGDNDFIEF